MQDAPVDKRAATEVRLRSHLCEQNPKLPLKLGLHTTAIESHLRVFIKGIILSALCSREIPQATEQAR